MTTGSAASSLQDNSLLGLGGGLVAIVAAGYVCSWAGLSQSTTTSVMGLAIGVPAAVELRMKSRRRNMDADIARIQRGELRRPVGLVVMLLAAAIVLLDSGFALLLTEVSSLINHVASSAKIEVSTANVLVAPMAGIFMAIFGMCLFLSSSYASHYFGNRPYLWTAAAVGCALAVREVVVVMVVRGSKSGSQVQNFARTAYGSVAGILAAEVVASLGILVVCMVGAWLGRRYHDGFLAKKLAHVEGKAAREAANQRQSTHQSQTTAAQASAQDSSTPQNSAPKLVTLVSRPNDSPSAPDSHRTADPIKQIEKLAHLRDTGALTEEEFQAKKTEILCRI
jgi:hypothetical protein